MTLEQQHKIEDALNRDLTPEEIAIIDADLTGDYEVDDIVELILTDAVNVLFTMTLGD